MTQSLITLNGKHGQFQCTPMSLDLIIAKYLPASINELNRLIDERRGEYLDYSYDTVTECLMVLAEFDGYETSSYTLVQRDQQAA